MTQETRKYFIEKTKTKTQNDSNKISKYFYIYINHNPAQSISSIGLELLSLVLRPISNKKVRK
jgi:hypothetical protein